MRFTRPIGDFAAKTAMPFFCAVPPTLPSDPEGVGPFPSAGPYVVTEYRPGERVTIRRNRFYGGNATAPRRRLRRRPPGLGASRGAGPGRARRCGLGARPRAHLLRAGTATRREVRDQQIAVLRQARSRPQAPRLQQRPTALPRQRAAETSGELRHSTGARSREPRPAPRSRIASPISICLRACRDSRTPTSIHSSVRTSNGRERSRAATSAAERPSSTRTTVLSRSRSRRQPSSSSPRSGSTSRCGAAPGPCAAQQALRSQASPGTWCFILWAPDFVDPFTYLNGLFDPRFASGGNVGRFDSSTFNRLMRRGRAPAGSRALPAYGELDVRLCPRRGAVRADQLLHRADARVEARRLCRAATHARPDGSLSQVARARQGA